MACFSPKPLYQCAEPTLASAALVQANRFAQQGRYDQALRLIEGEAEDSPTSLMVRMVCEWKGLKDLDRALASYELLRACSEAPPPLGVEAGLHDASVMLRTSRGLSQNLAGPSIRKPCAP